MTLLGNPQSRLTAMLLLTTIFFVVEIVVGYITNSMALIADSFHMFSDAIALVIAYISVRMSPKKWSKNTFGWARAEILGALVNAVFLCALCFSILIESIKRFLKPDMTHEAHLILIVGGLGLLINLIGLLLFSGHHHHHHHHHPHHHHHHEHDHNLSQNHDDNHHHIAMSEQSYQGDSNENNPDLDKGSHGLLNKEKCNSKKKHESSSQMNMRGVFLHVMADALGSVIVMISGIVVIYTDWPIRPYVDPILSVIMVIMILISTWPLLTESAMILLQTVPTHIQVDSLRKRLTQEVQGVLAVHEFHVWKLAGDRIIASAHIRCHNLQDYMSVAEKVKEFFHNEGIHSTTIQPEFIEFENEKQDESYDNCVLDCPSTQRTNCAPQTCCGVQNSQQDTMGNLATNTNFSGDNNTTTCESVLVKRTSMKVDNLDSTVESGSSASNQNQSTTPATKILPESSEKDNFQVI